MKILIFLALLSTPFFSQAEAGGNELLERCQLAVDIFDGKELKEGSDWKAHSCVAYITGLTTMNSLYSSDEFKKKDNKYFCRPQGVTNSQAVRVVLKHLKNNPKDLHESRTFLAVLALREAFSCKV
ncbi:hypothetical protein H4J58_04065 [Colwellia sp. MB3u-70]|uniref:Rap1a/Tai family immunity protein n=1 Tax=unclassified Colwellia TaxID=196834 RepID=UPI0015F3E80A|nr:MULTISPECIES: Rap1a/Tai family immunity protein [unclassified Colwellia]MBA6292338.1 hypothetical protein [Colwellia sp. MB3u-8]MBA6306294.1 hypothetical protein [Colwellia sp. MB3u-70]